MDNPKKRERNVNFSREETDRLVSLVVSYKSIIENKKSDAVTWQEKEKTWKSLEAAYNSTGTGVFRDAKHLKLKYEALKRDTRKKCRVLRAENYKTDGSVMEAPPLTPAELKIKELILFSGELEGGESMYEFDPLEVSASDESGKFVEFSDGIIHPSNLKEEIIIDADTVECKLKEKRPFDKLAEEKLEVVSLQKKIIEEELKERKIKMQIMEEELEEKRLKKQIIKDEMHHKNNLYLLEKEEILLKIEILKTELHNKKKL